MSISQSSSRADKIPAERKPFEQVQVGEIILGPTPGIREVDQRNNFVYSKSSRHGSQVHEQLVLGKDESRKELLTVVATTLGKIGSRGEKDIWARYKKHSASCTEDEWGAGLKYLIPLEPNTYEDRYDQPQLQIRYAKDTQIRYTPPILRWASVSHVYNIKPKEGRPLPGSARDDGKAGKSASIPNYLVLSGVKFDQNDCARALAYAQQRDVMPRGAKRESKAPEDTTNVPERNEKEESEEDGWTKVSGKGKGKKRREF